jgi:hypothetical protein
MAPIKFKYTKEQPKYVTVKTFSDIKKKVGKQKKYKYDDIYEIYCSNCNLDELPDDLPANLKVLNCCNNNLTELKLESCPHLEELYCYSNEINTYVILPDNLKVLEMINCQTIDNTINTLCDINVENDFSYYDYTDGNCLTFNCIPSSIETLKISTCTKRNNVSNSNDRNDFTDNMDCMLSYLQPNLKKIYICNCYRMNVVSFSPENIEVPESVEEIYLDISESYNLNNFSTPLLKNIPKNIKKLQVILTSSDKLNTNYICKNFMDDLHTFKDLEYLYIRNVNFQRHKNKTEALKLPQKLKYLIIINSSNLLINEYPSSLNYLSINSCSIHDNLNGTMPVNLKYLYLYSLSCINNNTSSRELIFNVNLNNSLEKLFIDNYNPYAWYGIRSKCFFNICINKLPTSLISLTYFNSKKSMLPLRNNRNIATTQTNTTVQTNTTTQTNATVQTNVTVQTINNLNTMIENLPSNLKYLYFKQIPDIETLILPASLEKIKIEYCKNLKNIINMPENIKELYLKRVPNVTNIDEFTNTKCESIYCHDTGIMDIKGEFPDTIIQICFNKCKLTSFNKLIPENVKELRISNNKLQSFNSNFLNINNLKKLNISNKELLSLPDNIMKLVKKENPSVKVKIVLHKKTKEALGI